MEIEHEQFNKTLQNGIASKANQHLQTVQVDIHWNVKKKMSIHLSSFPTSKILYVQNNKEQGKEITSCLRFFACDACTFKQYLNTFR